MQFTQKPVKTSNLYAIVFLETWSSGGYGGINTTTADVSSEHRDTDIFMIKELAFKGFVSDFIGTFERVRRGWFGNEVL